MASPSGTNVQTPQHRRREKPKGNPAISQRYCDPLQLEEQDRGELVFYATFHPTAIRLVLRGTCIRRTAS
ncbi:unnamed protein product [Didymodactylos carnosus]|uniref:Uncharacterized protein n=1 Tax=Didymodactylos carnosus TaxID=1234261 RepID=A0A814RS47_9BILA|nr:unnamed protein product [Didymodactylos carnosus]CAF1555676.1 unnamed protein product [Didymodactylos carnosus]CAF3901503.1 unnamed protein product [Didymodactylos carnosus]CAF4346588.1 unnamed protein product [Didymodactylos carnosus]